MIPVLSVEQLLQRRGAMEVDPEILRRVREILEDVRRHRDTALKRWTAELDGVHVERFRVSQEKLAAAADAADSAFREALSRAAERIRRYHEAQVRQSWHFTEANGTLLGQSVRPLRRVGVYVPGGKAAYPSSVLMNVIPAQVAGVGEVVLVSPPGRYGVSFPVAVAAHLLGVQEVYAVGGAQAVGALAYGTESIAPVEKITGPGNLYVALAKREVFGHVGIDMVAGPSEVLLVADGSTSPRRAAADMLAQAEHDAMASAILLTPRREWLEEVVRELEKQVATLPRREVAAQSIRMHGAVCLVDDLAMAMQVANRYAPEHLQLLVQDPWRWMPLVESAGAVFLGDYSPEPVGDYYAGPNHVLPTGGTARFSSPLGVDDFVKRISIVSYSREALLQQGEDIIRLARQEGLEAHARSIEVRLEEEGESGE